MDTDINITHASRSSVSHIRGTAWVSVTTAAEALNQRKEKDEKE